MAFLERTDKMTAESYLATRYILENFLNLKDNGDNDQTFNVCLINAKKELYLDSTVEVSKESKSFWAFLGLLKK